MLVFVGPATAAALSMAAIAIPAASDAPAICGDGAKMGTRPAAVAILARVGKRGSTYALFGKAVTPALALMVGGGLNLGGGPGTLDVGSPARTGAPVVFGVGYADAVALIVGARDAAQF